MDGYRGREDARARTTEKDEVEELESGAHEMKARGVRERERERKERERGCKREREGRDGIEKCGLGRPFSGLSPHPSSICHRLSPCVPPSHTLYSNYVNTTQNSGVSMRGKRVVGCREVDGRNIGQGLYLGFRRVAVVLGIEST